MWTLTRQKSEEVFLRFLRFCLVMGQSDLKSIGKHIGNVLRNSVWTSNESSNKAEYGFIDVISRRAQHLIKINCVCFNQGNMLRKSFQIPKVFSSYKLFELPN